MNHHNPMNMIRHDRKRVYICVREMFRDGMPTFLDDPPQIIDMHLPIRDFPKQAFPPQRDNGDEISTHTIIVSF
jgi:hypothetical protein